MKKKSDNDVLFIKTIRIIKIIFILFISCIIHLSAVTPMHSKQINQQGRSVSGIVTDTNGEPIIGASILVKGTTNGTITDIDGNYALSNITDQSVLIFSYVGMQTQDISVGNRTVINVVLEISAIGLQEVVAVGYITQKKR